MVLAVIGLAPYFQAIVSAEDVTLGKPDPQVFLTAAARLGSAPARSIVVEDAPAGIEGARRAGMASIGVRRNGSPLPADLAVSSLTDLPPDAFSCLLDSVFRSGLRLDMNSRSCVLRTTVYNWREGADKSSVPRISLHVWGVLTSACYRYGVGTRHILGFLLRDKALMSDRGAPPAIDASLLAAQELQNRFISDNLRRVFLLIYRIVRNVDDAQDLTQEAFIKALQRQDQLKELDKAAHWLSRIASNTAIDFLRRNGKVNFCEIDSLVEPLSGPSETPEQAVLRSEHRAYLEEGLTVLTERERTAAAARRRGVAGRTGSRANVLFQGHRALPHRQRADQNEALYGAHTARRPKGSRHESASCAGPNRPVRRRRSWTLGAVAYSRVISPVAPHVARKWKPCALRPASFASLGGRQMPELPNGLNWNRLSDEMTGNIASVWRPAKRLRFR